MHYFPFNPSAYHLSTSHWSEDRNLVQCEAGLLRDLAYRRLLDLYYGEEEPIPSKTRLVAIRIRMLRHEDIVTSVLKEKFTLVDGFWRQDRADSEIAKYQRKADAARENGKKGGRPSKAESQNNQSGSDPLPTKKRTRTTKSPLPPEGVTAAAMQAGFDEFWAAHPNKVGKPNALAAYAAALHRNVTMSTIMAGLVRHLPGWNAKKAEGKGDKIPHPTTWLNRDGWNDEVMPVGSAGDPAAWWSGRSGIERKGAEFGLQPPPPADEDMGGAQWAQYHAQVLLKAGDGLWLEDAERGNPRVMAIYRKLRNGGA